MSLVVTRSERREQFQELANDLPRVVHALEATIDVEHLISKAFPVLRAASKLLHEIQDRLGYVAPIVRKDNVLRPGQLPSQWIANTGEAPTVTLRRALEVVARTYFDEDDRTSIATRFFACEAGLDAIRAIEKALKHRQLVARNGGREGNYFV